MSKKIVLKVGVAAAGRRKVACSMTVAAKFAGVKSIAMDGEKGTLTVVGEVDVACLVSALRKARFATEVVSVGPEKEPEKKPAEPKKPDPPKPAPPPPAPPPTPPTHCCCSGAGASSCDRSCPRSMPPSYHGGGVVCYEEQDYVVPGCVMQ